MKNKERLITGIQDARNSHERWLNQSCLLLDREYIHTVVEPISCSQCEFTHWLSAERHALCKYPWFHEIEALHQAFHDANKGLFEQAQGDFDSVILKSDFANLEAHSSLLISHLDEVIEILDNTEDELLENMNSYDKDSDSFTKKNSKQLGLRRRLKQQDIERFVLEQKLTEQELEQLEERQELTQLGIEQILQYQQLKREEINQQVTDFLELQDNNNVSQESTQQEIIKLQQQILLAQDELEPLLWIDKKYEGVDKLLEEKKIEEGYEELEFSSKQEIDRLEKQRQNWQYEAEGLKQQLRLIEEDIAVLEQQQKEKQLILDNYNEKKDLQLLQLEEKEYEHDKLNDEKKEARKTKEVEILDLENDLSEKKQSLKILEVESNDIESQQKEAAKSLEYQLNEMEEEYRSKQHYVETLEQSKLTKRDEILQLRNKQEKTEVSLRKLTNEEQHKIAQQSLEKLDKLQSKENKDEELEAEAISNV